MNLSNVDRQFGFVQFKRFRLIALAGYSIYNCHVAPIAMWGDVRMRICSTAPTEANQVLPFSWKVHLMKMCFTSLLFCVVALCATTDARAELKAGAAVIDVTPKQFPVIVNGGFLGRAVSDVKSRLSARAIVVDDGDIRLAIVVVDSCVLPRPFLDEVKQLATQRTKIRPDRMLISATHTHSAPSVMNCFATADPTYIPYLRLKLVEAIQTAEANLEPAQVGWAVTNAEKFTALRRWILRPDRIGNDVFGNPTVRATMHAGANWDNVTGTSGPEDPDLSLMSFQSPSGRPIAVLANFSMHYFSGEEGLSADYFGLFCDGLQLQLGMNQDESHPPFVAVMSHGCSGDIWRRDYALEPDSRYEPTIREYSAEMVNLAIDAYHAIEYLRDADLATAEKRLELQYRVPDRQRLEWARRLVEAMGDREPENSEESYAREQLALHEQQSTEVVIQALRIGDIAIATTPTETYAITGLKLKLQSPLPKTMVLDLANGADGYLPPPEQHHLGGYNTWPMRGAGLEIQAEPKITEAALGLLENVSERRRKRFQQSSGPGAHAVLTLDPSAYWRLDELSGPIAVDSSGMQRIGVYELGVAFFLKGPYSDRFCNANEENRAAHFAGGRLRTRIPGLGDQYSISLWFWNGMPTDAREISGWMFSGAGDQGLDPQGDQLGVGGTNHPGKLVCLCAEDVENGRLIAGRTEIQRWEWNHVVFVRDGDAVQIYLNGQIEIETRSPANLVDRMRQLFFGGRCDNQSNWEGRLDEIAMFNRALSVAEIEKLSE